MTELEPYGHMSTGNWSINRSKPADLPSQKPRPVSWRLLHTPPWGW